MGYYPPVGSTWHRPKASREEAALEPVQVSVRFPPEEHARLVEHREATGIPTNVLIRRATAQALEAAGFPKIPKRSRERAEAS